jgi:hypothetical protein
MTGRVKLVGFLLDRVDNSFLGFQNFECPFKSG